MSLTQTLLQSRRNVLPTATGRRESLGLRRAMSEAPQTHGRTSSRISPRIIKRTTSDKRLNVRSPEELAQSILKMRGAKPAGPSTRSGCKSCRARRTSSESTSGSAPGLTGRSFSIMSRCAGVGPGWRRRSSSRAGPAERTLRDEGVDPSRSALIQVKGGFQGSWRLVRGRARRRPKGEGSQSSRRTPFNQSWHLRRVSLVERLVRLEPPRAVRGKDQGREQKKIHPRSGVTMCDDTTKSSVQAGTPEVLEPREGPRGRRRTRAERTSARGGMSSDSWRPGDSDGAWRQ